MTWILLAMGVFGASALLAFGVASWRENEPRAVWVAWAAALAIAATYLPVALTSFPGRTLVGAMLLALPAIAGALFWLPGPRHRGRSQPRSKIDERDTMFSRRELTPGEPRYEAYYARRPENRAADDRFRTKPGLLAPGTRFEHATAFAATIASFETVEHLHGLVEGEVAAANEPQPSHAELTRFTLEWTRKLGALDAGCTTLQPYHVYSTGGRRERYDQPVKNDHTHAIAFTVEMDHAMMQAAPDASTVMESAQQYLSSGTIAVQLAGFLRGMGYEARAHIDANYQVACPLVARDAGLGEIGRMGLLMTPRQGPRVRIGVVTTNAPLEAWALAEDASIHDFCSRCQKCAAVCPSHAISTGPPTEIDGVERWQIDSAACYTLWCEAGTDCGRCVATCPYAHPDTFFHNVIRSGIRRSPFARQAAVWLDDAFYGKKPKARPLPDWFPPRSPR